MILFKFRIHIYDVLICTFFYGIVQKKNFFFGFIVGEFYSYKSLWFFWFSKFNKNLYSNSYDYILYPCLDDDDLYNTFVFMEPFRKCIYVNNNSNDNFAYQKIFNYDLFNIDSAVCYWMVFLCDWKILFIEMQI